MKLKGNSNYAELISTYCLFMKKIQQSINELDTESDVLKHFCDLMLSGY